MAVGLVVWRGNTSRGGGTLAWHVVVLRLNMLPCPPCDVPAEHAHGGMRQVAQTAGGILPLRPW